MAFDATPVSPGGWIYADTNAYIALRGNVNTIVKRDLDETGNSSYLIEAGSHGDAYLNGRFASMPLPTPLPALRPDSAKLVEKWSIWAAEQNLDDSHEILTTLAGNGTVAQYKGRLALLLDNDLARLERGLDGETVDAIILYKADGTPLTKSMPAAANWYASLSGIEAVSQPNQPCLRTARCWW